MIFGQPRPWQAAILPPEAGGEPVRRIRTFGLDASLNRNAWRASPESILKYAASFRGKPGIWYESCTMGRCVTDHVPGDPSRPCAHILELQEPYRVSTIVDVEVTNEARAWLVHEVHDDRVWDAVVRGPQLFVSPSLCPFAGGVDLGPPDEWGRPISTLTAWEALHVAFVGEPAYGPRATVVSSCEGAQCEGGGSKEPSMPEFATIHSRWRPKGPAQVADGEVSMLFDDSAYDVMAASLRLAARALS